MIRTEIRDCAKVRNIKAIYREMFNVPSRRSCKRQETACDDQAESEVPVANLTNFKSCSSLISSHKLIAGRVDITSLATTYMANNSTFQQVALWKARTSTAIS